MNQTLLEQFKQLPQMVAFEQLKELLEETDVRLYGVALAPTKIRKMRNELMKRGIDPITLA